MTDVAAKYKEQCRAIGVKPNSALNDALASEGDKITKIDMSQNVVGKNGLKALFSILPELPKLEELILKDNYLTNENIKELCNVCRTHPSLKSIDLANNPISHAAGKQVSLLTQANKNIHKVVLDGTLINPALVKIIGRTVQENATGVPATSDTPTPTASTPSNTTQDQQPGKETNNAATADPAADFDVDTLKRSTSPTGALVPVALVKPGSGDFKCLDVCYNELLQNPADVSETGFTTTTNQGLAFLMISAAQLCETPSMTPTHRSPRNSRSSRNSRPTVTPIAASKPEHKLRALGVLQHLPTSKFPAVETLLISAFGSAKAPFPMLRYLRASDDIEFRQRDRYAINLLLSGAFGDPMPSSEDVIVLTRSTSPQQADEDGEKGDMPSPGSGVYHPASPSKYPPHVREKYAPLWALRRAVNAEHEAAASGAPSPKKEEEPAQQRHAALNFLLDIVADHPMDELLHANSDYPEANAELVQSVRKITASGAFHQDEAEKKDAEEEKNVVGPSTTEEQTAATATAEDAGSSDASSSPNKPQISNFTMSVPWTALDAVFKAAAGSEGAEEGNDSSLKSLALLYNVAKDASAGEVS